MKVTLIATVSANGRVLLATNPNHQVPQNVLGFFVQKGMAAGNLVLGYTTYSLFADMLKGPLEGKEMVVLSKHHSVQEGHTVVASPREAIQYLEAKGIQEIIVAGGVEIYKAFLEEDLVTDVYLNVAPMVVGDGGILGPQHDDLFIRFGKLSCEPVCDNIIRLHLSK